MAFWGKRYQKLVYQDTFDIPGWILYIVYMSFNSDVFFCVNSCFSLVQLRTRMAGVFLWHGFYAPLNHITRSWTLWLIWETSLVRISNTVFLKFIFWKYILNTWLVFGPWILRECLIFLQQNLKDWPMQHICAMWWHWRSCKHVRDPVLIWLDVTGILCVICVHDYFLNLLHCRFIFFFLSSLYQFACQSVSHEGSYWKNWGVWICMLPDLRARPAKLPGWNFSIFF